ncbi:MAG: glycoside hydrolase family 16 protein [Candidatus Saccharimonadales bacterium]
MKKKIVASHAKRTPRIFLAKKTPLISGLLVAGVAVAMSAFYLSPHADTTTTASFETESGTRTGVTALTDATASGGSAIRFGVAAPTPPSGEAMPVGDLAGWKQVFTEDFTSGNHAVGTFPGNGSFPGNYATKWHVGYGDNVPDTAGKNNGNRSVYYPSKVLSIQNGVMNMFLHSQNGQSLGAAPMPKVNKQTWPYNGQLYGKWTVRFKSEPIHGFKTAWLLWPDSGLWDDGEIDFPEGDLDGTISAFSHCANIGNPSRNCIYGSTSARYTSWHTASIEWTPGRVTFILDGQTIATGTASVPTKSMHYVMQTESCFGGASDCPAANATANLQVDWISIYTYNP